MLQRTWAVNFITQSLTARAMGLRQVESLMRNIRLQIKKNWDFSFTMIAFIMTPPLYDSTAVFTVRSSDGSRYASRWSFISVINGAWNFVSSQNEPLKLMLSPLLQINLLLWRKRFTRWYLTVLFCLANCDRQCRVHCYVNCGRLQLKLYLFIRSRCYVVFGEAPCSASDCCRMFVE